MRDTHLLKDDAGTSKRLHELDSYDDGHAMNKDRHQILNLNFSAMARSRYHPDHGTVADRRKLTPCMFSFQFELWEFNSPGHTVAPLSFRGVIVICSRESLHLIFH